MRKLEFVNLRLMDGTVASGKGEIRTEKGDLYICFLRNGNVVYVPLDPGAPLKEVGTNEFLLEYPAPSLYEKALGFSQRGVQCNIEVINGAPLEGKITKTSAALVGTSDSSITVQTDTETIEVPLHSLADIRENRLAEISATQ